MLEMKGKVKYEHDPGLQKRRAPAIKRLESLSDHFSDKMRSIGFVVIEIQDFFYFKN